MATDAATGLGFLSHDVGDPPLYHEGDVTVAEGAQSIAVWAPPDDPKFEGSPYYGTVRTNSDGTIDFIDLQVLELRGESPTYNTCSSSAAYTYDPDGSFVDVGETVCVKSVDDREQYGTVTLKTRGEGRITLHVKTWDTE